VSEHPRSAVVDLEAAGGEFGVQSARMKPFS